MSAEAPMPVQGLPEDLPAGERLLWQGRPRWQALAVDGFHVRKVAAYFALIFGWRLATSLADGAGVADAVTYAAWILPLAAGGVLLLIGLAWLAAWTTVYTVTSQRVVMRIGIALQMTVNLPFKIVESAALKLRADGSGDIALRLEPGIRAAYLVLWPHVRRWHFKRPEPSLRSVPDARRVADLMSEALAATTVEVAAPAPARSFESPPTPTGAGRIVGGRAAAAAS